MTGEMREERKVVTALFADVVGSTEMIERLGPEDARELLGDAVRRMVEAVEAYGGTVKDLAGDGVLALFGAPVAHEDDAERAIRAALLIAGVADPVENQPEVSVRVGIETGLVVLGPLGAGARVEYGATGDAINTAARLQSHARPGGVLVGNVTQRGVGDLFEWGEPRLLELKGKTRPIWASEVLRDRADRRRRHGRRPGSAPVVGREDELRRAMGIARRALAGDGGALLVSGEPGIGKSRLVEEVRRDLASGEVRWLEAGCVSFGESTPYLPIRELILGALEIRHGEPPLDAVVRDRLRGLIPEAVDEIASYRTALLGPGDESETRRLSPQTLRLRTIEALRRLVLALAERGPTVVAIEDLHWADGSTLHAIERLLRETQRTRLLFVLTTRGGDATAERLRTAVSALEPGRGDVIDLEVLPSTSVDHLVAALLEGVAFPADLLRRVVETAGGNPFFLTELVRSLIDTGVVERAGESWKASTPQASLELPTTIEKVVLARIDVLEPPIRDVLTAASVLGRVVSIPLLERVTELDPRLAADDLVRSRLFAANGSREEVHFAHALIQEVAYGTLLKRRRRDLHARTATAIHELWPDRVEENLGILAHHHRGAEDLDAARRCHDLAADRAERLHATEEALEHLTASLELATELGHAITDREVAERLLARARVRARTGDVTGAEHDLDAILAAVDPPADADIVMRAHDELGFVLAGAADYRAAVPHLQAAMDAAAALGDVAGEVSALSRLSLVHANRLDLDAALGYGERAMRSAQALGDERAIATAMDALKQVALESGDMEALDRLTDRLAKMHRRSGDLWLLQFAVYEAGYADVERMRLDRAFAELDESLEINRRIGDLGNEPLHVATLGRAHRARGDYTDALALGRRASALARDLDHGEWIAWTAAWLSSTLLELDAVDQAAPLLSEGVEAADRSASDLHLVRCLGMGAWAAYRLGDRDRAVAWADRATSILDRIAVRPPRAFVPGQDAYVSVARVRIGQGLFEEAERLVKPIVEACEACGWVDGVFDGSLVLAELGLRRGDAATALPFAERALAEARRTGLPTAWRAHAALAEASRVLGDEETAAWHVALARGEVARLAERVDDAAIREGFVTAAAERLSARGVGR